MCWVLWAKLFIYEIDDSDYFTDTRAEQMLVNDNICMFHRYAIDACDIDLVLVEGTTAKPKSDLRLSFWLKRWTYMWFVWSVWCLDKQRVKIWEWRRQIWPLEMQFSVEATCISMTKTIDRPVLCRRVPVLMMVWRDIRHLKWMFSVGRIFTHMTNEEGKLALNLPDN